MHRLAYDQLAKEIGSHFTVDPNKFQKSVKVIPMTGSMKGQIGNIIGNCDGYLSVQFKDITRKFLYTKVEFADQNGKPIVAPSRDMTGRPIENGNLIAYSISAGNNSHAFEIGKVIKTNPSGSLTVIPIVRNGERLSDTRYGHRDRSSITPNRSLILPFSPEMTVLWVLGDYKNINPESL